MDQSARARCDDEDVACGTNFMTMSVADLKEWHAWTFQILVFGTIELSPRLGSQYSLHFVAARYVHFLLSCT
jgi:hypothetical protein